MNTLRNIKCFINLCFLFVIEGAVAQPALNIGDTCPAICIDHIVNYQTQEINLSDLRGKLVLLDFGNINCTSCVEGLPVLDSLQRQFKDKIQIFWVTPDASEQINKFLSKNAIGKSIHSLPIIANDSILSKYFVHYTFPHEVWITSKGIVGAFTSQYHVDANSITAILSNKPIRWAVKREFKYDYSQSILTLNKENIFPRNKPENLYYSIFSRRMEGMEEGSKPTSVYGGRYYEDSSSEKGIAKLHMINRSIFDLYTMPLTNSKAFVCQRSNIILDVKNKDAILFDEGKGDYVEDWGLNHYYCYELSYPSDLPIDKRNEKVMSDLNYYLNLNGRIETRDRICYEIVFKSNNNIHTIVYAERKSTQKIDRDYEFHYFLEDINKTLGQTPVFANETLLDDQSLMLDRKDTPRNKTLDLQSLKSILSKYGLDAREVRKKVNVFVLSDK